MAPPRPPSGSWRTEARLDEWVQAKRAKDFSTADSIREELQASGVEPEKLRPKGWKPTELRPFSGSAATEALLDEWVEAKRASDFATADSIRQELHDVHGVAADTARPDARRASAGGGSWQRDEGRVVPKKQGHGDRQASQDLRPFSRRERSVGTEELLDKWVDAKRASDFETADRIREDLQQRGIHAEDHRPDPKRGAIRQRMQDWPPTTSASPPSGSWWAEARLDEWVDAKRAKDFGTADRIRGELQEQGLDAERLRPKGWEPTVIAPSGSAATEALLDAWVEAKRARDFVTADRIRQDLLDEYGIDADTARPKGSDKGSGGVRHDGQHARGARDIPKAAAVRPSKRQREGDVENLLDEWVEAKRARSFVIADSIRQELLDEYGIEAETARPKERRDKIADKIRQETGALLDEWVEAKRARDFVTADRIRQELLDEYGIDAETARPKGSDMGSGGVRHDGQHARGARDIPKAAATHPSKRQREEDVEDMLEEWVNAKRARLFEKADALRDELHALGVDAETRRPARGQRSH